MPHRAAIAQSALFGFAQRYKKPNGVWAFRFLWGRIVALFTTLVLIVWMALAGFVYFYFKYYRDYEEMTVGKAFAMPFDRVGHVRMVGDYNIKKAREYMELKQPEKAFKSLQVGVARSPKNLDGKMLLALFYVLGFNRYDYAIQALDSGFPEAKENPEYVSMYIKIMLEQAEDRKLVNVCTRLLEMGVNNRESRLNIAMALATVYALHGSYAKSNEYLQKYGLDKSAPGLVRIAKNYWEQGLRDDAINTLKNNINVVNDKESIYSLLMSFYNIMGDYDTARQYAVLRSIENPLSVRQRVDYLKLLSKSGDKADAAKQIEVVFDQYKNDSKSLMYVANFAAVEGNIDLMRRIYDTALQRNYPIAPFCLLYLETMLSLGDYKGAAAFSEDIMHEKPLWSKRYEDVLNCLRAVAYYASGNPNMSEILINEVLKRGTVPVKTIIATSRRLEALGATNLAYKMLDGAVEKEPRHQLALTRLVQLEIKIGNSSDLDKNILKLLQMRRPPKELIEDARENLGSDKFIFANDREKIIHEIVMLVNREGSDKFLSHMGDDLDGEVTSTVITDTVSN